jgi:uncharacterized protein (TIGR02996 family)
MPTEADLLAEIAAHPGEVERWLILADWLEDQDDPRAELARLRWQLHAEPRSRKRRQRVGRQLELIKSGLSPVVSAWTNSVGMRFAVILPGSFTMGTPRNEPHRSQDEVRHGVTLTHPYFLGIYPVTVGEFGRFVTATGYRTQAEVGDGASGLIDGSWSRRIADLSWRAPGFPQDDRSPVVCVSWNDAQEMIRWLNEQEPDKRHVHSLPTEAQWEYACRAGTETAYWWGPDPDPEYGWLTWEAPTQVRSVTSKKPNPWGLYQMSGMIFEWCDDAYGGYDRKVVENPHPRVTQQNSRVIRGGNASFEPRAHRSGSREHNHPDHRGWDSGFRLAVTVAGIEEGSQ